MSATRPKSGRAAIPMQILLHEVPWAAYKALRDTPANDHIRMTYLDGTLELMSPEFLHEKSAERLGMVIRAVARAFDVPYQAAGTTTFRRRRRRPLKGHGLEADASFYFRAHAEQVGPKTGIDLRVDPPPDLVIEVDHTARSRWKLPVYARLRVPEVWRFDVDAGTLWFGRLGVDGAYGAIERSEALPMLPRAWVVEAVTRGEGLIDSRFEAMLEGWVRDELGPPGR